MEPTLPSPNGFPEIGHKAPISPERHVEVVQDGSASPERPASQEQKTGAGAGDNTPPPMPVVPLPPAQGAQQQVQALATHDDTNPASAADEDLIEKEWVEKAKKVIADTKHDPYAQELAVSRLQADYLNKRYGKIIKLPREE